MQNSQNISCVFSFKFLNNLCIEEPKNGICVKSHYCLVFSKTKDIPVLNKLDIFYNKIFL